VAGALEIQFRFIFNIIRIFSSDFDVLHISKDPFAPRTFWSVPSFFLIFGSSVSLIK
jgi:hypothetical protein